MCRGEMARGAGGGVGERRGWLCSKSNGGRRGRSEGLESPQNENGINTWRQVCAPGPTCVFPCLGRPNMRVSTREGGERRRVSRTLLWSNPQGQASMPPSDVWPCTWHSVMRNVTGIPRRYLWNHGRIGDNVFFVCISKSQFSPSLWSTNDIADSPGAN